MRIPKQFLRAAAPIVKARLNDGTGLGAIEIDPKGWAVATDGRVLIAGQFGHDAELPGQIRPHELPTLTRDVETSRANGAEPDEWGRLPLTATQINKGASAESVHHPSAGKYPDWRCVCPSGEGLPGTGRDEYEPKVGFDARILGKALAVFDGGIDAPVQLYMLKPGLGSDEHPINPALNGVLIRGTIDGCEAFALVMPVRIEGL
jgi:hypothetical protein